MKQNEIKKCKFRNQDKWCTVFGMACPDAADTVDSMCKAYTPMTNRDMLARMTAGELGEWFAAHGSDCVGANQGDDCISAPHCHECWAKWLESEAAE